MAKIGSLFSEGFPKCVCGWVCVCVCVCVPLLVPAMNHNPLCTFVVTELFPDISKLLEFTGSRLCRDYRSDSRRLTGIGIKRGREWINASLDKIKRTFDICSGNIKEVETIPRRSKRLSIFDKYYEVDELP